MIIPKKHFHYVTFLHDDCWYKVTGLESDRSVYHLYKEVRPNDYEFLGTGNNPLKLEDKVREGKYK